MHQATALVPLAVLSAAWTISMAGAGLGSAAAGDDPSGALPDGTTVPAQAIEAPASVSSPGVVAPGVPRGRSAQVVDAASTSGIPAAALAAYQRAEAVINAADKTCELPWQLIAAIGRVESDHGRFGGNVLSDDGVAQPGIYGIALDGKNDTQRITDTDAGQYDSDAKYDRAVGPMQFIPSTWAVVGVDGDNDGRRDPQDIDDAALATAVYLCSGDDDLSAEQGQRASVYRYNHSNEYVDLVLSIMQAYMDGDFLSVPTRTTSSGVFAPDPTRPTKPARNTGKGTKGGKGTPVVVSGTPGAAPTKQPTQQPTKAPTQSPTQQPTQSPTQQPTKEPTKVPTTLPSLPVPTTLPPLPSTSVPPLDQTLTYVQAVAQCTTQGVVDNPLTATNELDDCANALLTP
ncbi:lytic transglycosylase domain-containing protein [Nocardioides sp. Soil805]|uniref:lytic transglycosylase domain-containing protein n=1 Tax=Nocardioides sp. Soil805 TaxID=1736416 RepID=UPI002E15753F